MAASLQKRTAPAAFTTSTACAKESSDGFANAGNADTLTDFNASGISGTGDAVELSLGIFTALATTNTNGGTLAAGDFASGAGLTGIFGAGVNVIYDNATGGLYYDSNGGNTTTGRSLIATLNPLPSDTFDFNDIKIGP